MDKNSDRKELNDVIDLFISPGNGQQRPNEKAPPVNPYSQDLLEPLCDVEKTIRITKKMGFTESRKSQEQIKKLLSEYLDKQYSITEIRLKKTVDIIQPGQREERHEEVIIFVKEEKSERD